MIEVVDEGALLTFEFPDLLRYSGPGSPAGVAIAYQAMTLSFPLLDESRPLARREITVETAFRGPGARDGFELVTRGLTEGRYTVTASLERPTRGTTLEQFVFRVQYHGRAVTLLVRDGIVSDEFITFARMDDKTPAEEAHFSQLKATHAQAVLAARPDEVFEVEP